MSISISTFLSFQTTSKLPDSLSAPLPPALTPHTQVNDIVQTSDGLRHTRASTTYIKGDEPPTASLGTYLRRQGQRIEPSAGDGNYLFRTFSYQLTGTQDEHLALRTIAVRVQNLNKATFQPFLTEINKPTMEEHIQHLLVSGVFGTHMEILAIATFYGVPVFYCCPSADQQYSWHCVMPSRDREVRYPDLAGCPLEGVPPPTHFELSYIQSTHYDSVVSITTGKLSEDLPKLNHGHVYIEEIL